MGWTAGEWRIFDWPILMDLTGSPVRCDDGNFWGTVHMFLFLVLLWKKREEIPDILVGYCYIMLDDCLCWDGSVWSYSFFVRYMSFCHGNSSSLRNKSGNILFFFGRLYLRRTFLVGCWDKPGNKQIPTDSSLVLLSLLGGLPCIPIKGRCIPQSLSLMWTLWFTWPWVNVSTSTSRQLFSKVSLGLAPSRPSQNYINPPKMDGVWLVKTSNVVDLLVPHGTPFFEPQPAAMSLAAKEEWSQVPACCDWLQERDTDAEGEGWWRPGSVPQSLP